MLYVDSFTASLIVRLADEAVYALEEAHKVLGVTFNLFDMKGYSDTVKAGVLRNIRAYEGCYAIDYKDGEIMCFLLV